VLSDKNTFLVMMWKHSFVVMSRVVEVFKMTIVLDNNDVNAQLKILAVPL
jgi:hypothetical protein